METFATLLALVRRTTDTEGWLNPLMSDPDSAVVLGSAIAVFARAGATIPHNAAQATLSDASGGLPGTSQVTLRRASGATSGVIPRGFTFVDPRGCQAVLVVDVTVGGQTSLVLPVQTLRQTELVNTEDDPLFQVDPGATPVASSGAGGVLIAPAAVIVIVVTTGGSPGAMKFTWAINNLAPVAVASSGPTFPFAVPGTLIELLFGAGTYDVGDTWTVNADGSITAEANGSGSVTQTAGVDGTTFQVLESTQILGGAADYLSVHGATRGVQRQPNETTANYRARIRNIPDAVTPVAISQTMTAAAQQLGLPPFLLVEPFENGATPSLKARFSLSNFNAVAFDVGDFFDDPLSDLITVDRRIATAYFELDAQDYVTDPMGYEMFFDDGSYFDDPQLGYPEADNTLPPAVVAALFSLAQDVAQKKAGGVNFDVFLKTEDIVVGEGSSNGASPTQVFTVTPPTGEIWLVDGAFAGHDCSSILFSPDVSHYLVYDLEDGTHLTTAAYHGQDTQRPTPLPTQRVTAIHGFVQSDGFGVGNLVAWFLVRTVKI